MQKHETRPPSYTTHKNKFKMSQRRKCSTQNHKNPRENIGIKVTDITHRNVLLAISPLARATKKKIINKRDYIKLKFFCIAKEIINKIKSQPTEWENIFANTSEKELISKSYKVLKNSTPKKQTMQFKKWAKDLNRCCFKEDIQMANRHMKRCSVTNHQRNAN